ncbi:hypothetical protein D9758_009216 [Tetrapyrgos nigripes]|uniref:Uncharacterized protein n=1 Tax=Tetrapyrgos nigripes TaxID=182062 RepID=A0A8H5D2C1_9AGAR|nr:hypothetical protein D9758_009216 [Tetrapyrgos nigripes]
MVAESHINFIMAFGGDMIPTLSNSTYAEPRTTTLTCEHVTLPDMYPTSSLNPSLQAVQDRELNSRPNQFNPAQGPPDPFVPPGHPAAGTPPIHRRWVPTPRKAFRH